KSTASWAIKLIRLRFPNQSSQSSLMTKMSRQIRSVLTPLVCFCVLLLHGCTRYRVTNEGIGWTLPNDHHSQLSDYKGKIVILDFYATYCEPCLKETPHLVQLDQQYARQGLQIIGINVGGEDDHGQIPAYAKEFGITYPLGLPDDALVRKYLGDNENIPQAYVFDREGRLLKHFIGYNENVQQELDRVVLTSLSNQVSGSVKPQYGPFYLLTPVLRVDRYGSPASSVGK